MDPKLTKESIGAAFELRSYGGECSEPTYLVQASIESSSRCFDSRSVKIEDFRECTVTFTSPETCYIFRAQKGLVRYKVRPIDVKSLFPPEPDAQNQNTSTDNPSTVDKHLEDHNDAPLEES